MNRVTAILITAMVLLGTISFVIMPRSDFSENENRALQEFPKATIENITDGSFTSELTSYLSDHFPFRDKFVGIKTEFEEACLLKKKINNIYICRDNYFIEDYNKPENTKRLINTFNKFAENTNIKPDLMLIPTAVEIYDNKLPEFSSPYSQLDEIQKIYKSVNTNNIDVYGDLINERDNEQLFYRLDHHWTTDGAYVGYAAYCRAKGIIPIDKSEFDIKTVSEDFKGTIYSKLNDYSLKGDSIKAYYTNQDISVLYDNSKSNSLYSEKYLKTKDKYSYFLDNIHSYIEITNNAAVNDNELVVAKDSYANSLIPFLVNHYRKVYVFDPRSYKGSISKFANEHKNVKDILVLYNMNTIDKDTGVNVIY